MAAASHLELIESAARACTFDFHEQGLRLQEFTPKLALFLWHAMLSEHEG